MTGIYSDCSTHEIIIIIIIITVADICRLVRVRVRSYRITV